jgi:hypothetical protein
MTELEFHRIQLLTHAYAWDVQGIDPIGAADIHHDWSDFIAQQITAGKYETPEKSWELFALAVLTPVYGLEA